MRTGGWRHREWPSPGAATPSFCLEAALESKESVATRAEAAVTASDAEDPRPGYLTAARELGEKLIAKHGSTKLKTTERDLIPFVYV